MQSDCRKQFTEQDGGHLPNRTSLGNIFINLNFDAGYENLHFNRATNWKSRFVCDKPGL